MPLHKSEDGWARLRANVRARRGVRAATMEYRPVKAEDARARRPRRAPVESVRMRGRRRFRAE